MQSPITLIIFNRPDTTALVFEEIRRVKPTTFFVVADGPRLNHPEDPEKIAATRAIIEKTDWPCKIYKNYSEINMGCKQRVSSGLDWVFSCVEESIILEDDCLPDESFFYYCHQLLEKYRDDKRIMMVSGRNHLLNYKIPESYLFTRHFSVWGWASWRRAWNLYNSNLDLWNSFKTRFTKYPFYNDMNLNKYYYDIFDKVLNGKIDTWDYQWLFSCLHNNGLNVAPKVNLVKNIGILGTHTGRKSKFDQNLNNPTYSLDTDLLIHPAWVIPDYCYDSKVSRQIYGNSYTNYIKRILFSLRNIFNSVNLINPKNYL